MSETNDGGAALDKLFAAMGLGDVVAAMSCFTPDARVWHSFDRIAHDQESLTREWASMFAACSEHRIADVRRAATPDGFVQQHLMIVRPRSGPRRVWPVCVVVRVRDGLVARLDEYMDRAGSFELADGAPETLPDL